MTTAARQTAGSSLGRAVTLGDRVGGVKDDNQAVARQAQHINVRQMRSNSDARKLPLQDAIDDVTTSLAVGKPTYRGPGARIASTRRRSVPMFLTPCGTPSGATSRSPARIGSSRPSSRNTPSPSMT
jgi:hypothetical protein